MLIGALVVGAAARTRSSDAGELSAPLCVAACHGHCAVCGCYEPIMLRRRLDVGLGNHSYAALSVASPDSGCMQVLRSMTACAIQTL